MAVLAEDCHPDVGDVELWWKVVDADLAFLYYLVDMEESQSRCFPREMKVLLWGTCRTEVLSMWIGTHFLGPERPRHAGAGDCFLLRLCCCHELGLHR